MTKAEAIAMLKRIQEPEAWEPQINQAAFEALDMAIEALSQESSEDVISRQAAIDAILAIKDYGNSDRANALGLAECAVTTLPSVQPEQIARDIATIIENEQDMRVILNAPSAQSEIIRCKDCMHNGSFDTDCPIDWNGKEYCSFAERKEDE